MNKDDITAKSLLNHVFNSNDLGELENEVKCVLSSYNSKQLFQTLKYHFNITYGSLKKIKEGFIQYPPQYKLFFVPSLTISKYKDNYPILYHNKMHSVAVDFKTYDFDQYTTVLNPTPVYDREKNMIIRDYHTNVCKIQPMFLYLNADMAKLSTI